MDLPFYDIGQSVDGIARGLSIFATTMGAREFHAFILSKRQVGFSL
jgi:hypothetical protein